MLSEKKQTTVLQVCIVQPSMLKKWWREIIPSSVCITEGLEKELRNCSGKVRSESRWGSEVEKRLFPECPLEP